MNKNKVPKKMTETDLQAALSKIIKGRNGAPDRMLSELLYKWECGFFGRGELTLYYDLSDKQLFEMAKALKKP